MQLNRWYRFVGVCVATNWSPSRRLPNHKRRARKINTVLVNTWKVMEINRYDSQIGLGETELRNPCDTSFIKNRAMSTHFLYNISCTRWYYEQPHQVYTRSYIYVMFSIIETKLGKLLKLLQFCILYRSYKSSTHCFGSKING